MTETTYRSDIKVELIQHAGSDEMIAKAARVSTGLDQVPNDKIKGLINYLVKNRHTSPLEHTMVTVRVAAPIFVAREAMRHRMFSYNETSGRYSKLAPEFYVPELKRPLVNDGTGAHPKLVASANPEELNGFTRDYHSRAYTEAWIDYTRMLDAGVATEVARNVLPVGTYTSWYQTGNLHSWLNFLSLRIHNPQATTPSYPQWEIEQMALQVEGIILDLFPVTVTAWLDSQGTKTE